MKSQQHGLIGERFGGMVEENRTSAEQALEPIEEMIAAAEEFSPEPEPEDKDLAAAVRIEYAQSSDPIGSLPDLPEAEDDEENEGYELYELQRLGPELAVFFDKLGERLAFERSGVRLYDALISKFDAYGGWEDGPQRIELERFREQELAHFHLLHDLLIDLGADPTAVTPSADLAGVASMGLVQVLTDPRTDFAQSLEAILIAELVDNDCWKTLAELARKAGGEQLAQSFDDAIEQEEEHLERVRAWIAARMTGAGVEEAPAAR